MPFTEIALYHAIKMNYEAIIIAYFIGVNKKTRVKRVFNNIIMQIMPFDSLVVRLACADALGAVQLLQQYHPHQAVWKGEV